MKNPNPSGNSDVEELKWAVSRIDLAHKTTIEYHMIDIKTYEKGIAKDIVKAKEWKNYLLAAIGASLTVLLGSTSIFNIDAWISFSLLVVLAMSGACIFVIFTKVIKIIENISADINLAYYKTLFYITQSYGYITTFVFDLSKLNYDHLANYMVFTNLLQTAVMLSLSKELEKMSIRYKLVPGFSKSFEKASERYKAGIEFVTHQWQNFDKTKPVPPEALKFVEETLKEYIPKETRNA